MNLTKWEDLARHISTTVDRHRAHISLIVRKNQLVAIGTNTWKTHPMTVQYGYMTPYMHSELDAYRKIKVPMDRLELINFRFSKTGKLGMSRPCVYCMPWCSHIFDRIIYTNEKGKYNDQ